MCGEKDETISGIDNSKTTDLKWIQHYQNIVRWMFVEIKLLIRSKPWYDFKYQGIDLNL